MLLDRRPATGLHGARSHGRRGRLPRMLNHRAGYLLFVQWAAAGKLLDDPAVVIAAGKAHSFVDAGRILPQDMLYRTLALHEFLPVQYRQIAQTKNAVLHREFVSRLLPAPLPPVGYDRMEVGRGRGRAQPPAAPAPDRSAAEQHGSPRGRGVR